MLTASDGLLIGSGLATGLAGVWHCALMCGPLCAALPNLRMGPRRQAASWLAFLLARGLGYGGIGAGLAGAASWSSHFVLRGDAGALSPWLTVWAVGHALAFGLGLWMMWRGRQPPGLARLGPPIGPPKHRASSYAPGGQWVAIQGPQPARELASRVRAAVGLGLGWSLLPCGLLQSAWVMAGLGSGAAAGGLVMLTFAVATSAGLMAGPWMLARLERARGGRDWPAVLNRLSGLMLCMASGWALGHGLWTHVRDYC